MFCRNYCSMLGRSLLLGVLAFSILITPSSVYSEDFRILLVKDGEIDRDRQRPAGDVVIKGGYLDGVEVGMTGTVWRKNKFKGKVDMADVEVTEVSAYESTGRYIVRHVDFFLLKKDRVALEPVVHSEADILATAVDRLGADKCCDALLLFENIFCAMTDNSFVQAQISECLTRVNRKLAEGPPEDKRKRLGLTVRDYLELATRHHKYKNDLAADMYLKRIATLDATNQKAAELRQSVPHQNYESLLSPARCE